MWICFLEMLLRLAAVMLAMSVGGLVVGVHAFVLREALVSLSLNLFISAMMRRTCGESTLTGFRKMASAVRHMPVVSPNAL